MVASSSYVPWLKVSTTKLGAASLLVTKSLPAEAVAGPGAIGGWPPSASLAAPGAAVEHATAPMPTTAIAIQTKLLAVFTGKNL